MTMPKRQEPPRRSLGTKATRREPLPWAEEEFRLLSIDGGGIRGILPAAILAECERRFLDGRSVAAHFDLVAGTSTGGIIALGLASGLSASDILSRYLEQGQAVFPRVSRRHPLRRALQHGWLGLKAVGVARYDSAALAHLLDDILGERLFGDAEVRLVIPSFDQHHEVNVFKTPHHPDYRLDWKEAMVSVARATSAAPTYLPVFALGERRFGDGGLWANNPIMLGLVDVLACHAVERHTVRVLSLGCGSRNRPMSWAQANLGGLFVWRKAHETAMQLASENALGQTGLLIGRERLLRLDHRFLDDEIELDDYERAATELPLIARALVEAHEGELSQFFDAPRPPYTRFHPGNG